MFIVSPDTLQRIREYAEDGGLLVADGKGKFIPSLSVDVLTDCRAPNDIVFFDWFSSKNSPHRCEHHERRCSAWYKEQSEIPRNRPGTIEYRMGQV